MEILRTFRHEYKFAISYDEMLKLRSKLNELLPIDRSYNGYMIRSLYFDTVNDNDYYDKQGGEIKRKKIRIRIYDVDESIIKLEVKNKYDYHQLKESLIITREDAEEIIRGNYYVLNKYDSDFAKNLYLVLVGECYLPKVIIEYDRIAYMTPNNTRITFDFNIKKSDNVNAFFDKDINYINLTYPYDIVLEVKFDRFLEPFIANILSKYSSRSQSFSKYVLGRNI